mgnify:FL=1
MGNRLANVSVPLALSDPGSGPSAVPTANTGTDANGPFRALYVGAAGAVKVTTIDGDTVTFPGVPAGFVLPVSTKLVWTTGTTVATPNTNIIGLK